MMRDAACARAKPHQSRRGCDRRRSGSKGRRATAWIVLAAVAAMAISGCTLILEPPHLEWLSGPAFRTQPVLLPYQVQGGFGEVRIDWELSFFRDDIGEWEPREFRSFTVPAGVAGTIPLDLWEEGLFEISGQLFVTRGGNTETRPGLGNTTTFYVDMTPYSGGITVAPPPGPGYGGADLEVNAALDTSPDTDYESPVSLYYRLDSTTRPTTNDTLVTGPIPVWQAGEEPAAGRLLWIVAIDEAGNVGTQFRGVYQP